MKKQLIILISIVSVVMLLFEPSKVLAERVYGNGSNSPFAADAGHNKFLDETVLPPLSNSWTVDPRSDVLSSIPIEKGFSITGYRFYAGSKNAIYGISNQTGSLTDTGYVIGNPFEKFFPSSYGYVSSNTRIAAIPEMGTGLYFGTSNGFMGAMSGLSSEGNEGREFRFSPATSTGISKYYGGAIQHHVGGGTYSPTRVRLGEVFASNSRLHFMNGATMLRDWYFDLDQLPNTTYVSGDKYSGLISLPARGDGFMAFSHSVNDRKSYGLIWSDVNAFDKSLGEYYSHRPDAVISYVSGVPKVGAYDETTGTIIAIDQEGRAYFHDKNGVSKVNMPYGKWLYAGDSQTRGYNSVGGVLLHNGSAYFSTLDSSQGTGKGTISRINIANPSLTTKTSYVHDAAITTQPIYLSGILYFGDSRGRVYALDPNTMKKIAWYRPDESTTEQEYTTVKTGEDVVSLIGSDNHLIAGTSTSIVGWKGRPDYIVSDIKDSGLNQSIHNNRYNFTSSTLPSINIRGELSNIGSFDYSVYTDFLGQNDQQTALSLKNMDTGQNISIDPATLDSPFSVLGHKYASERANVTATIRPYLFQLPAKGENGLLTYPFKATQEGKYEVTFEVNADLVQKEFLHSNNTKTATFDVVDMRIPTIQADKALYKPGETITLTNSKTQNASYSSYKVDIIDAAGTTVYQSSNTTFASILKTSLTKAGTYRYRISITNRYGDTLTSSYKSFDIANTPPVADFNWNPATIYNDTNVNFLNTSTDVDGDTLTYKWEYKNPVETSWTQFSTLKNPAKLLGVKGNWNIRLTVSDGIATDVATKTVTVENRNPVAEFTWNPATIYNNTNVNFVNTSADQDNDTLTSQWAYQEPNSTTWVNFSTATNPSKVFSEKGAWNVRLTVTDGSLSHSATKSLTVQNRPPVANFNWNPTTIYNDTSVTMNNTSSDSDNDSLTYQWAYQEPGSSTWVNFSTAVNPAKIFTQKGTWNVRLIASDGTVNHTATKALMVQNRGPVANFNWNPATIYNDTNVNFVNTSADVDKDSLTYQWAYQEPNSSTWVNFSTATNPSKVFNIKGNWQVRLTASDGATSDSITKTIAIGNRAPISAFDWNPTSVYTNTNVKFSNNSTDPDNDTLTYQWAYQKPGTTTWTNFSTTKTPTEVFDQKGSWNIRLITSDGETTTALTKVLTVLNTPPEVTLDYSPATVFEGDTVTLKAIPTDIDGDQMTVIFEENQNGIWKEIRKVVNVSSAATVTHTLVADPKNYQFRVRAIDESNGVGTATVTFVATPLEIIGSINHTADWEAIHAEAGHLPEQFYSGERFLTEAVVTDHPIEKVTVSFAGEQITGNLLTLMLPMVERAHPIYEAEVYESVTGNPDEHLAPGMAYFVFEAKWKNGVIKQHKVSVDIVSDVFGAFDFYRSN